MLTSKDLMIGDWYAFRGHPYKCTASDIEALAECEEKGVPTDISEIPITAEILEKNGFETEDAKDGGFVLCDDFYDIFIYEWSDSIWVARYESTEMNIPFEQATMGYVHELQHFLRASGIEKEIEL